MAVAIDSTGNIYVADQSAFVTAESRCGYSALFPPTQAPEHKVIQAMAPSANLAELGFTIDH